MTHERTMQKHHAFMAAAQAIASLGTCDRKQVGAVIVKDGRCISWGFNGAPPGVPHCDQNMHGWHETDWPIQGGVSTPEWEARKLLEVGCRNATHAEANTLAFAARQGISTDKGTLYVTVSPCDVCARLIIAAGISMVYYDEEYRDPSGRELLQSAGVGCYQVEDVAGTDIGGQYERNPQCVANWPECFSGGYDPRCCRFPKSCSC
jgi:dCMP deaminase